MSEPSLESIIIEHEGMVLRPYCDGCAQEIRRHKTGWYCGCVLKVVEVGNLTIGVGHNLDDRGITDAEALSLLRRDLQICVDDLNEIPQLAKATGVRRQALVELRFMLGFSGFREFSKLIAACAVEDWDLAANEMLASRVYQEAPLRITHMSVMLRYNQVPQALASAIAARRAPARSAQS